MGPVSQSQGTCQADTLVRALQEEEGGWGQYRLESRLRLRLREAIRAEVRSVVS